jgi:uracil-DNA glycosylase
MLWGGEAKKLKSYVNHTTTGPRPNLILDAPHPVAGSRNNVEEEKDEFLNSHHFSEANEFLKEHGKGEIDWTIPYQSQQ